MQKTLLNLNTNKYKSYQVANSWTNLRYTLVIKAEPFICSEVLNISVIVPPRCAARMDHD